MRVSVTINLDELETFGKSAEDLAAAVLETVGGDPATDMCWVTINLPAVTASVGTPADPGPPPPEATAQE